MAVVTLTDEQVAGMSPAQLALVQQRSEQMAQAARAVAARLDEQQVTR